MSLPELNKDNFSEAIKSDAPVFVKYYMDGCGPCKMMEPIISKISSEVKGVAFFEVNVDKNPSLASKAKLSGVPAMILYKNEQELGRIIGYQGEDVVKQFIDSNAHKT